MNSEELKFLCFPRRAFYYDGGYFLDEIYICYQESTQGNINMKLFPSYFVYWKDYTEDYSCLNFTGELIGPPDSSHIWNTLSSNKDWVEVEQFWHDKQDMRPPTKNPEKIWTSLDGVEFKVIGFFRKRRGYNFIVEIVKWLSLEEREKKMKEYFETNKVFLGIPRFGTTKFPLDIFWRRRRKCTASEYVDVEDYSMISFSGYWKDQLWQWFRKDEKDMIYTVKDKDKIWTSLDGVKFKAVGYKSIPSGYGYIFVVQILNWPNQRKMNL